MHPSAIVNRKAAAREKIAAALGRLGVEASLPAAGMDDPELREMRLLEGVAAALEALAAGAGSRKTGREE